METQTGLSLGMTFTAFMVMLGPMKLVGPYAALTSHMEEAAARKVAVQAVAIACLGALIAAVLGQKLISSWGLSTSALHLTAGIILLLVALAKVLAVYDRSGAAAGPPTSYPNLAFSPLAFPTILTPYGLAVLMLLLAMTNDFGREIQIGIVFLTVMLLNLVVMWFAKPIVQRGGGALALLDAVLGVLQVALAIQMILAELRVPGVLPDS